MSRYEPSERILRLRERAMHRPHDGDLRAWRDALYLEGWREADGAPLPIRSARALAHVIRRMPVRFIEDDLIVGEHGGDHAMGNFRSRPDPAAAENARRQGLPVEAAESMERDLARQPFRYHELAPVVAWPGPLRTAQDRAIVQVWGSDLNHSIRAYEKVLNRGFEGILADIDEALAALAPDDPAAPVRRANLEAFRILCAACCEIGARHAESARLAATLADDPAIRARLLEAAEACEHVPARPARTFREAIQSLWFAHMITVWEDNVNANGLGRIDQFLLPVYERDRAAGTLDDGQARELLAALWVKLYQPYDVQQMVIGGQTPTGEDAVNPLSYLALEVTEAMGFVRCLSARLHRGTPRPFVERCVDLIARGGGIPFFFNDEAIIPAMTGRGIPLEDARDYAAIGCIELTIPGKAFPHAVSNWVNLARVLEVALNGGRDPRDGVLVGPPGPTLAECDNFEAVYAAFEQQLDHFVSWASYGSNAADHAHRSQYRLPYLSLLTDDCVARGQDIVEGGARHNYHSSAAMGIPNVADSLAALRAAVYERGLTKPAAMLEMLRADFAGAEDLRSFLLQRLPKYGNDEPLPDALAARLTDSYIDQLDRRRTPTGGRFFAHLFTFVLMLPMGRATGATPDGRRAGEPLAYSLSPGQGRDRAGLTAALRSLAAIPHRRVAAGSSAILEADPALLEGPGRQAFVDLLVTAIDLGVGQLQFNVVDADTLTAAQQDPAAHPNLCVRVSGFSQQFTLLDREMQDHIIARTKHRTG